MKTKNNKGVKAKNPSTSSKPASKSDSKESKLQNLVKNSPHFEFIESGKIKCILTKHEFAPTLENY